MAEVFRVKIGSAQLMGEHSGAGRALLLLHAGVADRRMWHHQVADLSDQYHTIAYDRRGFGETIATDEAFSHVEDLREVLEHLGISEVALIGCSQGGRIALDFALTYPQRITALGLIAPAVSGAPTPGAFPTEIQARMDALDEADEAEDLALINTIEANLWLDGPTSPAGRVDGALRDLFLNMNGIALDMPELTKEIEPVSAYERVADLSCPTLIMWGELDFPHIRERCQYLVDTIPVAMGEKILDTAHLPSLEKPEAINKLLRDFLK